MEFYCTIYLIHFNMSHSDPINLVSDDKSEDVVSNDEMHSPHIDASDVATAQRPQVKPDVLDSSHTRIRKTEKELKELAKTVVS